LQHLQPPVLRERSKGFAGRAPWHRVVSTRAARRGRFFHGIWTSLPGRNAAYGRRWCEPVHSLRRPKRGGVNAARAVDGRGQ
jgi:hypothetical protein